MDKNQQRLVGVNVGLLGAIAIVTIAGSGASSAQPGGAAATRARGDYTILSGRVQGSTTNAVWILDAANQELVALSWDRSKEQFSPIGYRSLSADEKFQQRPR